MSVKDEVLHMLEANKGSYFSGATLAKELKISALTVKKAYDSLENEGFTVTIHGKGTYVTATNTELLLEEQKKELESDLERVIQKGRCYGISDEDIKKLFELILEG
jgi:GntR family transcriptional regulator